MLELLTVPKVHVLLLLVTDVFKLTTPPTAQPSLPLPGELTPGYPAPPYATAMSIHPLALELASITDPGNATHIPAMVPVYLMSNLDTAVRTNFIVKYCVPERPALKFGPAGK